MGWKYRPELSTSGQIIWMVECKHRRVICAKVLSWSPRCEVMRPCILPDMAQAYHRRTSRLELRPLSTLIRPRILEELLRRRCRRLSLGSRGDRSDLRAKRFKMSVRDTTPVSRPEMLLPGRDEAEMEG